MWRTFDSASVFLAYPATPDVAHIVIARGGGNGRLRLPAETAPRESTVTSGQGMGESSPAFAALDARAATVRAFHARLVAAGFGESYEAAHARLILEAVRAAHERQSLSAAGKLPPLPEVSQAAADKSYVETATKLCDGLAALMKSYEKSPDERARKIFDLWTEEMSK
jgi:hypothetical protein